MVRLKIKSTTLLGLALVMASCAAPKPTVVVEAPVKPKVKAPEVVAQEPEMPTLPSDDAPRLPDGMLNLPSDTEFRPSSPVLPKVGAGGVVIRPPTDPPSRVKPKDPASE
jgi:hypothetical protein